LESLDLDQHCDPYRKFFIYFFRTKKNHQILGKNQALDLDPHLFQTLDPDPREMDTYYPKHLCTEYLKSMETGAAASAFGSTGGFGTHISITLFFPTLTNKSVNI